MLHPKFNHLYPDAKENFNDSVLFYHRLMESYKFAYAKRMYLGDDNYDDCHNITDKITTDKFIEKIVNKIDDKTTHPSKSGFYENDVCFLLIFV